MLTRTILAGSDYQWDERLVARIGMVSGLRLAVLRGRVRAQTATECAKRIDAVAKSIARTAGCTANFSVHAKPMAVLIVGQGKV
jgi:hypothetical protein